jgi:hypothetical protein
MAESAAASRSVSSKASPRSWAVTPMETVTLIAGASSRVSTGIVRPSM